MSIESTSTATSPTNNIFSNNQFSSGHLPNLADLAFEDLSPKYAISRFIVTLCFFSLFVIFAFVIQSFDFSPFAYDKATGYLLTLTFALFGLLISFYLFFSAKHKHFALREQDLSYASGLIFKKVVTQPILRIQHIELKRGPVARKIGLANLQVFSAGGALHTFEIPGLPLEVAEKIRHFILQHKDLKSEEANIEKNKFTTPDLDNSTTSELTNG